MVRLSTEGHGCLPQEKPEEGAEYALVLFLLCDLYLHLLVKRSNNWHGRLMRSLLLSKWSTVASSQLYLQYVISGRSVRWTPTTWPDAALLFLALHRHYASSLLGPLNSATLAALQHSTAPAQFLILALPAPLVGASRSVLTFFNQDDLADIVLFFSFPFFFF